MEFDPSRLRRGEWIVGASAVLLLVSTFFLPWYGLKSVFAPTASSLGVSSTLNGWHGLTHLRWLVLVTIVAALALVFLQATRRAPALPVSMSVIVSVLGTLTVLALLYRVLINTPGPADLVSRKAGAFLGLIGAVGITYGAYASMRQEGLGPKDARTEVETVRSDRLSGSRP
jgi:hypothetical protein